MPHDAEPAVHVSARTLTESDVDVLNLRRRHCVLAARKLGSEAEASFLDDTFLADRATTVRRHLERNPGIMTELPPPSLAARYSG